MSQKKSYSRYFIILQEDEKGYSLASDKISSGYAKLEMKNDKCKISYYVQNLKKQDIPYCMLLICSKKDVKKLIKIGELNIDDNGRADVSFEYTADNIAETGIPTDKVSGAAIVKFINSDIIPVMSGFASTDIPDWKSYVVVENMKREVEEKVVEKSIFDKYEESIEESKDEKLCNEVQVNSIEKKTEINKEEVKIEKNSIQYEEKEDMELPAPVIDNERKEDVELPASVEDNERKEDVELPAPLEDDERKEDIEVPAPVKDDERKKDVELPNVVEDDEKSSQIKKPYHEEIIAPFKEDKISGVDNEKEEAKININKENTSYLEHEHNETKEKLKDYPKGPEAEFFNSIIGGFEELDDVCGEIKRCRWFKVPVSSMSDLSNMGDYNKYLYVYYPMLGYYPYMKKYGHYIFGYKCDVNGNINYIVYGIPGTKYKMEQPFGGRSGFVTWMPLKDGEDKDDNFGYWLMFYDFRTSTIVIPVK